jgi:nitroreductase
MLTKTWRDILEIAQRAPSPHNVQPWKVRITSEETCDVYIDIARTLPKEDTTGSFIISGMVMYLETMRYAAQTYQQNLLYELKLNEVANKSGLQLFATVTIQSSPSIIPEFKRGVILQRRTSRLPYAPKVIAILQTNLS